MSANVDAGTAVACSVAPMLSVRNGARAVEFYKSAFGAIEVYRVEDPGGSVVSRLSVDGAEFWLAMDGAWAAWSIPSATIGRSAARLRGRARRMPTLAAAIAVFALAGAVAEPQRVSFETPDGGRVYADLYGKGARGVVLAHGARFNKESWQKQARTLADAGFRALAIDFRGRGQSRGPQSKARDDGAEYDVLAAVRYLRATGAKTVSVVGASFGGTAAAQGAVLAPPGEIDRLVLLAHGEIAQPERMQGRKLFVVARNDANDAGPRLDRIRRQYERAPDPKELLILEGPAHAQLIFETDQGERLMREIVRFLSAP